MPSSKLTCVLILMLCLAGATASHAQNRGQFAFVHSMTTAAGGYSLTVDYAELLSGEAAERAARDAGRSPMKGGVYIENRTKTLSTLTVPAWAQIYLLQNGRPTLVKPAVLYNLLRGEKSPFGAFYGFPFRCEGDDARCLPVRIIRRGGQVLRIDQEELP